jgi:hypothetical protein
MNNLTTPEIATKMSTMLERHISEKRLEEALEKQASSRTSVGRFVMGLVVARRERQADQLMKTNY